MTKPANSAARCDQIISSIDECLAEVDANLRVIAGGGRTSPTRCTNTARRHLVAGRNS
jgi:hypothetical protein